MFKHINIENLYLNFCKIYLNRINKLIGKSVKQFCSKMKFVMLSEKKLNYTFSYFLDVSITISNVR